MDFSNKTFAEFFEEHFEINIYADTFSLYGTSKFNRLRAFLEVSPPHLSIELLELLWDRKNSERDDYIETATLQSSVDEWMVNPEYVLALEDSAAIEDRPFKKLIDQLAKLPSHTAVPHLQQMTDDWTLGTVELEITRALENIEKDPEAAITAASSMIESLCRSILVQRSITFPKQMDIKNLYREVREPLGLSPSKSDVQSEVEGDARSILSALSSTVQGIGALRTHAGTAHGRERGFRRIDPRIARLAVNSASTMALFLVETWQKKYPEDKLVMETVVTTPDPRGA